MQINKLAIANLTAPDTTRITGGPKAQVKETTARATEGFDSVRTAHGDLVQMVLEGHDEAAAARVAQLRSEYAAGTYSPKAHEIAEAILTGVLAGY